mgnify:CR=1 FL=1
MVMFLVPSSRVLLTEVMVKVAEVVPALKVAFAVTVASEGVLEVKKTLVAVSNGVESVAVPVPFAPPSVMAFGKVRLSTACSSSTI